MKDDSYAERHAAHVAELARQLGPCKIWEGYKQSAGYGEIQVQGKRWLAHRWTVVQSGRELPPGAIVRHLCDNPSCVNPDHLVVGTARQNQQERSFRAPRNATLKLLPEQVQEIRAALAAGHLQREIAARFGVDQPTISDIKTGRKWAYLPDERSSHDRPRTS